MMRHLRAVLALTALIYLVTTIEADQNPDADNFKPNEPVNKRVRRQYNPQAGSYAQVQNGYSNGNGYQNGNGYSNGNGNGNGYSNGNGYMNGYANGNMNPNLNMLNNGAQMSGQNPRMARQNRLVNIADNWERIPFIFQTYK